MLPQCCPNVAPMLPQCCPNFNASVFQCSPSSPLRPVVLILLQPQPQPLPLLALANVSHCFSYLASFNLAPQSFPVAPQCLPMFVVAPQRLQLLPNVCNCSPTFASVNQRCLPMAQCLSNPFNRTAPILIVRHCLPTFAANVCQYPAFQATILFMVSSIPYYHTTTILLPYYHTIYI